MSPRHLSLPVIALLLSCDADRNEKQPLPEAKAEVATALVLAFDGSSAFQYLLAQTAFGPRNPGSMGHSACLKYFQSEFSKYADTVFLQRFSGRDGRGNFHQMTNVFAMFNRELKDRLFLSAHWDTRPWADQDPDPANHSKPILGANDGASGVAVLLELARILKANPPPVGVDIVLFDGEDLGVSGNTEFFSLGAKYFAANLPAGFQPRFGINLDMVGDKNLFIQRERYSDRYAPEVNDLVFGAAKMLGISQLDNSPGEEIYDDHIPLNLAGIRTIDLSDFNYPDRSNKYWHTMEDTADKCSEESLEAIGNVLLKVIYAKAANF
jgi:hypothetical protein